MKTKASFLAFDTSCYTTSAAIVSEGRVIYDKRLMLEVADGGRGLRQSEAVFRHVRHLKQLFFDYSGTGYDIKGVGMSTKPCPADDSYMPVFAVGESFATAFAAFFGAETYAFSHQHGHLYSAFFGGVPEDGDYGAFHVSGGTMDILKVRISGGMIADIAPLGGTLDITCGQLIDRIGVAAGLKFPAGAEAEKLYREEGADLAVSVKGLEANLSGAETQALWLLREGHSSAFVLSGVIDCVAETLARLTVHAAQTDKLDKMIFTGGVISNLVIRNKLADNCRAIGCECILAPVEYCGDNACGLALAAQIHYDKGEQH